MPLEAIFFTREVSRNYRNGTEMDAQVGVSPTYTSFAGPCIDALPLRDTLRREDSNL